MRPQEWAKIKKVYKTLVSELDLVNTLIVDTMYEKGVLTYHEKDTIDTLNVSQNKNRQFLKILRKKADQAYGQFRDTLYDYQKHLYDHLDPPMDCSVIGVENNADISKTGTRKCFEDITVAELQEWLKPVQKIEKIPPIVLCTFCDEEIDGKVFQAMTDDEIAKLIPSLKFGQRKRLLIERDKAIKSMRVEAVNTATRPILKRVKCTVKKYEKVYILRKQN